MPISSPGVGSNLDVNSIITQLMQLEQRPLTLLVQKEASYQAKLSGFGTLKGALSSFQSGVSALSSLSKFQGVLVNPADTTVVSATGSAAATPGTYGLEVTQLAQAQKLATTGQADSSATIGAAVTTTLTFDFGTISGATVDGSGKYTGATFTSSGTGEKTVTIDSSNNSLSGIRDAINTAAIGVSATIVNDGGTSPYRLVLTESTTGKTSSMKISVSGDAAVSALLGHDPGAAPASQALAEMVTAQNAEFEVDGIAISKANNKVTDVIQGVTLNLLKTNAGSPTNIAVSRDTASVTSAVDAFVKAYNDVSKNLSDAQAYNATTKSAALLNGEASVRTIQTQIRNVLSSSVAGGATVFTVLSDIGVTLQKDGTLAVDSTKLQSKIASNFDDFAGLFAAVGKSSDSLVSYSSATSTTAAGAYPVSVTALATKGNSVGSAAANLTISAGVNDTIDVLLDGVTSTVTLAAGTYASAAALATEVQSKINGNTTFSGAGSGVTVTESGGTLTLTSNRYGSTSTANVTGGNGMTDLVGGAPVNTTGADIIGTINGSAASGSGQFLTGATGNASEGLKIQITGGSTGARGTINYSLGYAYQFEKLAATFVASDGLIASRTDGINSSLKSIAQDKITLGQRLTIIEKRYRAQFTALDVMIGSMTTTSNFLTQQLSILSNLSTSS